jgi:ABC-type sugar transport system permease subunit
MIKKRRRSIEKHKSRYGLMFVLPWLFGMVTMFIVPLVKSIQYAFSEVFLDFDGNIGTEFVGFENFEYLFSVDPNFVTNLKDSIVNFSYSLPIIVIISFLFAILLNQKFKGRLIARAIFFLPVIIATGVVMDILTTSTSGREAIMSSVSSSSNTGGYLSNMVDFNAVLMQLNFPVGVVELFSKYISGLFDLVWSTGIQTVLFISGLQTIPPPLYEVSKIEGATKWEEFWYITFPMMRNIMFLVMVFTTVDLFVTPKSLVVSQAYMLLNSMSYGLSSAMLWAYFLAAGIIAAIALTIYHKACVKRWE